MHQKNISPFNVLSIDGGGMRGLYSAKFLEEFQNNANKRYNNSHKDFGKLFNLITGTSTGAILACALANNIPLTQVVSLYRDNGKKIFPKEFPKSLIKILFQRRRKINKEGEQGLRDLLKRSFGTTKLIDIYNNRKISLSIPAVDAITHKAWVFKTPHIKDSNGRDDNYSLVDVCMASTAAPIYRSLAAITKPDKSSVQDIFVDGGLWANNPVLIGLVDALQCAEKDQPINIYCLGTTPAPSGSVITAKNRHWGLFDWKFGSSALALSMDAQSHVYDHIARLLAKVSDREINIYRFYQPPVSGEQADLLALDATSSKALNFLEKLAGTAIDETNSRWNDKKSFDSKMLTTLFTSVQKDKKNV